MIIHVDLWNNMGETNQSQVYVEELFYRSSLSLDKTPADLNLGKRYTDRNNVTLMTANCRNEDRYCNQHSYTREYRVQNSSLLWETLLRSAPAL